MRHPRLSLLALALLPALACALPAHGKKQAPPPEPKPPTYEEAVEQEQKLLDSPMAAMLPQAGLQFDDDALLRVIDQADHEGKAGSLPEPVAKRLSEWRQAKESEEAFKKAPWQHGPLTVTLDGPVLIDVPKGYKLLASADAAKLVQSDAQDSAGKALLASEDDTQLFGLGAVDAGHYDPVALALHPEALKEALDDHYRSPLMPVPQPGADNAQALQQWLDRASWLQEPHYDEQQQILSWSNTQPSAPPHIEALRLGRTWLVQIIATGGAEPEALLEQARKLAAGVHFKPGQAYSDTIPSDPRATTSVEQLVSGGPNPMQQMVSQGLAASLQADQDNRDSRFNTMLLRIGGLVLALIAAAVGAANRKKGAAEAKDVPGSEGGNTPQA